MRVGLAARSNVADTHRSAAARAVDQGHLHRNELFLGDHLVDDARHEVGAAADSEGNDEFDIARGAPLALCPCPQAWACDGGHRGTTDKLAT